MMQRNPWFRPGFYAWSLGLISYRKQVVNIMSGMVTASSNNGLDRIAAR
jgi:hypothetical protein